MNEKYRIVVDAGHGGVDSGAVSGNVKEKDFNLQRFNDHLAATLACKASIKANTSITMDESKNLIEDLRKCDNPFNCPHGRPTIITYTKSDLEKLFKRSGF